MLGFGVKPADELLDADYDFAQQAADTTSSDFFGGMGTLLGSAAGGVTKTLIDELNKPKEAAAAPAAKPAGTATGWHTSPAAAKAPEPPKSAAAKGPAPIVTPAPVEKATKEDGKSSG